MGDGGESSSSRAPTFHLRPYCAVLKRVAVKMCTKSSTAPSVRIFSSTGISTPFEKKSEHSNVEAPRRRVAARQPAVDHQRGCIDVAGVVGREEQGRSGNLVGLAASGRWIQLADAGFLAAI